ncbi:hypothetical protein [Modestobacter sp. I12A-02662]|uniref:hypothetical protein n=1 Tax=Modestobacter sp. I12A-02662 TaxID=1730496 RepID=UPI0034DDEA46
MIEVLRRWRTAGKLRWGQCSAPSTMAGLGTELGPVLSGRGSMEALDPRQSDLSPEPACCP